MLCYQSSPETRESTDPSVRSMMHATSRYGSWPTTAEIEFTSITVAELRLKTAGLNLGAPFVLSVSTLQGRIQARSKVCGSAIQKSATAGRLIANMFRT